MYFNKASTAKASKSYRIACIKDKGSGPSMQIANKMDIITTMAASTGTNPIAMLKTAKRVAKATGKVISSAASGGMTPAKAAEHAADVAFGTNTFLAHFDAKVTILNSISMDVSFFMTPDKMKAEADLKLGNLATAELLVDIALPNPSKGKNDMHVKFAGSVKDISRVKRELLRLIGKAKTEMIKVVFPDPAIAKALSQPVDKLLGEIMESFAIHKLAVAYDSDTSAGLQIELVVRLGKNKPLTMKIEIPDIAKIVITMVKKALKAIEKAIEKIMTAFFNCNNNCKLDREFCDFGKCKPKLNTGKPSVFGAKSCKSGEHRGAVCVDCVSDAECLGTYTSKDRAKGWAPKGVQSAAGPEVKVETTSCTANGYANARSLEDCKNAAAALGWKNAAAAVSESSASYPPGCYRNGGAGASVYFNNGAAQDFKTNVACSAAKPCVCHRNTKPAPNGSYAQCIYIA